VLLAQAMDLPTEVERLAARDEERARRFTELRRRLDELGGDDPVGDADGRTTAEERIELAGELVRLMAQIRGLKGFERFLMPLQTADLVAASGEGPVALINVSRYGSAAFVIRPDGVAAVDLPDLSPPVVRAMAAELLTVTDSGNPAEPMDQAEQNRRLTHLLGWLWDAITGPVLGRLGLDAALAGSGPRMWWCPSGLLSFLPLHAAGHHGTRSEAVPRTVMDRVVSSYVPTVRVLVHARRAPARASGRTAIGRTLVVAPGTMGVPGTADEAAMVGDLAAAEVIGGAAATPKAVLAALGEYGRVHFACHALSDLDDPSAGYLELHDQQRLAVSEVAARRLEAAELAFLSACSTYRGGPALADEAVHLGSAFQMAGYRHVIATLWPALDTPPTVRITRKVYQGITGPAGAAAAASALHQATRYERDRAPGAPSMWAAHVHSGP
jgi:hypothetical protein